MSQSGSNTLARSSQHSMMVQVGRRDTGGKEAQFYHVSSKGRPLMNPVVRILGFIPVRWEVIRG